MLIDSRLRIQLAVEDFREKELKTNTRRYDFTLSDNVLLLIISACVLNVIEMYMVEGGMARRKKAARSGVVLYEKQNIRHSLV